MEIGNLSLPTWESLRRLELKWRAFSEVQEQAFSVLVKEVEELRGKLVVARSNDRASRAALEDVLRQKRPRRGKKDNIVQLSQRRGANDDLR